MHYCLITVIKVGPVSPVLFLFFLAVVGLRCHALAFSTCSKQRLLSSWGVSTSRWGGFSCCRAQTLGLMDFVAPCHAESSRNLTYVLCCDKCILNQWTTKKVLHFLWEEFHMILKFSIQTAVSLSKLCWPSDRVQSPIAVDSTTSLPAG